MALFLKPFKHFITNLQHLRTDLLSLYFIFDILHKTSMVMPMIKFAICDDEPFMAKEVSEYISDYMKEKSDLNYHISSFYSGRSLLESPCDFDVIFLDIKMEELNGMNTAKLLRQRKHNGLLIFITILKDYVFDAFEVQAYDYLMKPLSHTKFKKTMSRAMVTLEQRAAKSILLQSGNCCKVIPLSQIVYCEVQGRKIYIHQEDQTVTTHCDKLEHFEQRVDKRFFRCHRSYLVNLDHVRGSHNGQITLSQGSKIPVSRLREHTLTQALLQHMTERNW